MISNIIDILRKIKEDKTSELVIEKETNILDEVGLDSLEMINFILELEETFDIDIDFDDFDYDYLNSVETLSNYIANAINLRTNK